MVRRAVASNVGNFAGVVEGHLLLSDVVPVFEALASDDQDNVRLLAVEQAGKVAKAMVDQVRDNCHVYAIFHLANLTLRRTELRLGYSPNCVNSTFSYAAGMKATSLPS